MAVFYMIMNPVFFSDKVYFIYAKQIEFGICMNRAILFGSREAAVEPVEYNFAGSQVR